MTADGLRPARLDDFGGQDELVGRLRIILEAAKVRGEVCDHLLFSGPPGLGKTTLSHIVAAELGADLVLSSGPAIERGGDLAGMLTGLAGPSVVFIDEIHRLDRSVEEILYSAMEDSVIDIVIGEGAKARPLRMPLQPFVLVGATTQAGMLSAPLRDRFGFVGKLRPYQLDALARIVARSAGVIGVELTPDGAAAIAARSRGTPRIANALLRRARDWAQSEGVATIDGVVADSAMDAFGIDALGLDAVDREVLEALCGPFAGTPVGLTTLAACVGESPGTLEEVYEPFLMSQGLLVRTPRGRMATEAAYEHLGLPARGAGGGRHASLGQRPFEGFGE